MAPGNTGEAYVQKINFKHVSKLLGWIVNAMLGSMLKICENLSKGCSKSFPDRLGPLGSGQGPPLLQWGARVKKKKCSLGLRKKKESLVQSHDF